MDRPLRPVMRWTAPLLTVRDVPAGQSVGYGQTWRAERDSRVGLVPIGYADGYPRAYSNKAGMLVDGRLAPVVGRVSMDLTVIDLTDIPSARPGDEVVVLDSDPLSPVSVYRLAEWAGTIAYEVFCRIGPRVKRVSLEQVDETPTAKPLSSDLTE
jgi:alanine racemase